jgi:myo-inositol-1-phosphate synthase
LESKTEAVRSQSDTEEMQDDENIHISPSGHVGFLDDTKWAHMFLQGEGFLGAPVKAQIKLEVEDSPNSGGVAMDAIRCCKLAMDRNEAGSILPPSQWFMKSPETQREDSEALAALQRWLKEDD